MTNSWQSVPGLCALGENAGNLPSFQRVEGRTRAKAVDAAMKRSSDVLPSSLSFDSEPRTTSVRIAVTKLFRLRGLFSLLNG